MPQVVLEHPPHTCGPRSDHSVLAEVGDKWDINVKDKAIAIMRGMATRHAARRMIPTNLQIS